MYRLAFGLYTAHEPEFRRVGTT